MKLQKIHNYEELTCKFKKIALQQWMIRSENETMLPICKLSQKTPYLRNNDATKFLKFNEKVRGNSIYVNAVFILE